MTESGDYRGIYGHQYTPNYSAAITELLRIRDAVGDSSLRGLLIWRVAATVDLDELEALLIGDLDDDGRSALLFSAARGLVRSQTGLGR